MTDRKDTDEPDAQSPESGSQLESDEAQVPVAVAQEPAAGPDEPPGPPPKAKGRGLALLALLLALGAGGGVGYLYYMLVYSDPLAAVRAQTEKNDQRFTDLQLQVQGQLSSLGSDNIAALDALRSEYEERLAGTEAALVKSLNQALNAAPPSQREWKLAEAEYLMRIANHRVLMEQDSNGALNLLVAADQILADLDDFALHQVRARLADEIVALKQVRRDDLQGIYLRLEALKQGVSRLPLLTPKLPEPTIIGEVETTIWQDLGKQLKDLIVIRPVRPDEVVKPLLAPDEFRYLELNLRLSLEQAQLATLKRQQAVYEQSLSNLAAWLSAYANVEHEATTALLGEVAQLSTLELARPLPDVSGSLNELLSVARGDS